MFFKYSCFKTLGLSSPNCAIHFEKIEAQANQYSKTTGLLSKILKGHAD